MKFHVGWCDEEVELDSTLLQEEIGSSATFLIGARTRNGRAVRFNNLNMRTLRNKKVTIPEDTVQLRYI